MAIVFFRTVILFTSLLVIMRLLGKRQMGELELSEFVVSVLIADLAAMPLQDIGIPLLNGLLPITILFSCELIISGLTMRSIRFRSFLCGKPCVLIKDGRILQRQMRLCRFTVDELMEKLRGKDIDDISKVRCAVLETDGTLSTILFASESPVTASQLGIRCQETGYPYIVIDEGRVLLDNLKKLGLNERWLEKRLEERSSQGPEEVYLMIVYEDGSIYFAAKEETE